MPALQGGRQRVNLYYAALAVSLLVLLLHQSSSSTSASARLSHKLYDSFSKPHCPTPWLPVDTPPLAQQSIHCEDVPSNSTDFRTQLCSNRNVCNQGYVQVDLIDKEECELLESTLNPAPKNKEENLYIKRNLGPHTLAVLFDGAERYGMEEPVGYAGGCSYRYPYHLHNGGGFALKVILVYDQYHGLDAIHQGEWQPILSLPLVEKPFLSTPSISCPQRCPRYTIDDFTPTIDHSRPVCTRNEPITGSWIPSFNSTVELDSVIHRGKFPPYAWISHRCRLESTAIDYTAPVEDRAACFGRNQRVLLTGDSHLRWLYDGLAQRLMGSLEGKKGGEAVFGKATEKDFKIGGLTFDYFTDPVLAILRDDIVAGGRYAEATHVVLTAVQWLMHQPFHEYRQHIDLLLKNIGLFRNSSRFTPPSPNPPPKFIWFNSPAWPHRADASVREHNDTRTNARLKQMNDYASMRFAENGFGVVDGFATSIGFCTGGESPDSAHFYSTPVIEVMERLVAHRLDLCN